MPPKPKEPKPPVWAAECPNGINIFDEEEKEYQRWCEYICNDDFTFAWVSLITKNKEWVKKDKGQLVFNAKILLKYPVDFAIVMMDVCLGNGWKGVKNDGTQKRYKEWLASQSNEVIDELLPKWGISNPFGEGIEKIWRKWKVYLMKKHGEQYIEETEQVNIDRLHELSGGNLELAKKILYFSVEKQAKSIIHEERGTKEVIGNNSTSPSKRAATINAIFGFDKSNTRQGGT